jgi:hypothetical protein
LSERNPDGPVSPLIRHEGEGVPTPFVREGPKPGQDMSGFQGVVLDLNDPVETAMNELIHMYRYRKPGLMIEGDVFATFLAGARALDLPSFGVPEALLHLIQQEQARINAMRRAGTLFNQDNTEAQAAYLEMAFHANLLYAWVRIWMGGR